ncbi:MAG: VCBS repeat-containing protein [Myxococcaceae bacterium]|nr:VCBS repeat-containing protein [Myxococcaceae bacterium]
MPMADAGTEDAGVVEDAGVDAVPTTNAEHQAMLRRLGFSTAVGPRTGPAGEALPEAWHPLKTRYAAFAPRLELYLAGGPTLAGQSELFLDDKTANHAALPLQRYPDQTWIGAEFKNGIAVDVDDDGRDELFVVYFAPGSGTLRFLLLDPNDGTTAATGTIDVGITQASALDHFAQPSLAAGDLDRDGVPEVAVGFGRLYLLRGLADGQPQVVVRSYPDFNDVNVAIGSIDRDPQVELVVTHTETRSGLVRGFYEVFDGSLTEPFEQGELRVKDAASNDHFFGESRVAIADVDGDHVDDVVFHGRRVAPADNAWHYFLMRHVPTPTPPETKHWAFRSTLRYSGLAYPTSPRMLVLPDVNGDGVHEVHGWGEVLELGSDGTFAVKYAGVPGWSRAAVGNVDADRRDDLLVATNGGLQIWGLDALDTWKLKTNLAGAGVAYDSPVLVPANTDDDSPIVRYDGESELLFTDPTLVTVVASPPWQAGIGQNVEVTQATFGTTENDAVVRTKSLGFKVGFSVGTEFESDLFQSGVSAKATFESAFDVYTTESRSVETSVSYSTAPGADKVVFTTVPFDVYYYTIVSSPRGAEVGTKVTINLPRKPQMMGTSVEFYNAHNGGGLDVDARILRHTPGDVWSYPTLDDRKRLLSAAERETPGYQALWNGPVKVDESGSNGVGINTSQGSARGASMDFSTSFEFEAKTGGVTVGTSVGFHYGQTFETSTEQGAVFQGTVGAIPGAAYAEHAYCYGLMVYPQLLQGRRFVVLNWWTQKDCAIE